MTARKSYSRLRASGSGGTSLTPTKGRKPSAVERMAVANAARAAKESAPPRRTRSGSGFGTGADDDGAESDDDEYEFVAPKFHDFLEEDGASMADEWFGG